MSAGPSWISTDGTLGPGHPPNPPAPRITRVDEVSTTSSPESWSVEGDPLGPVYELSAVELASLRHHRVGITGNDRECREHLLRQIVRVLGHQRKIVHASADA